MGRASEAETRLIGRAPWSVRGRVKRKVAPRVRRSASEPDRGRRGTRRSCLQSARPMPVPAYSSRGVQALEDREDLLGVLRVDADAVVGDRELARRRRPRGRPCTRDLRAPVAARNLMRVADQVLEQRGQQASGRRAPSAASSTLDGGAGVLDGRRSRLATAPASDVRRGRPARTRSVVRPTREKASRSLISCCMRWAPSTA